MPSTLTTVRAGRRCACSRPSPPRTAVDRYLELVNPMLTVRELRAEVTEVHRSTADSVTLTLRPTRQWRGFRAGQFVQLDRRDRRRAAHPLLLAELLAVPHRRADRDHRQGAPGRARVAVPARERPARPGRRALAGRRHLLPARPAPRAGAAHQRRQRHHAGAVDAAHAVRRGLRRRGRLPALRVHRGRRRAQRRGAGNRRGARQRPRRPRLHRRRRRRADRVLRPGAPRRRRALASRRRDLPVRAARLDAIGARALQEARAARPPARRGVRAAAGSCRRRRERHASRFEATGTSADNTGSTLLEQAEAAGLAPEYGCRMGICFSCTQIKTSGCTRNIRTGETNSDPDTEIQLCINVPVGDVAIKI